MALRIRFQYPSGSQLGYSIERLSDGKLYDFSAANFVAAPATLISPLPEDSGSFLGRYKDTLTPTSPSKFTDGDYSVTVHDLAKSNQVVAELAASFLVGDDATVDPWSVALPGTYGVGTIGATLDRIANRLATPPHATNAMIASAGSGSGTPLRAPSAPAFQAGPGSFTVGGFVNLALRNDLRPLLSKWNDGGTNSEYMLMYGNGPDSFAFVTNDGTSVYQLNGKTHPATGSWYFVVGMFDRVAGKSRLFVNDVEDAPAMTAAVQNGGAEFEVAGAFSRPNWYLAGGLAMAFKYSSALTPVEMTWLYNNGRGRSWTEVSAQATLAKPDFFYDFADSGNLGFDRSANSLNLSPRYATPPTRGVGPG